jgi:pSer/pThr/pTyr-binding forkhead associated (FHA) protein
MASLSIGRSAGCDIVIADPTVSRRHARIAMIGPDAFLFVDSGSTSGSYRMEGDGWLRITRSQLANRDRVRLGEFETTVADLLARAGEPERRPPVRRVERDPATGRIVVREQ